MPKGILSKEKTPLPKVKHPEEWEFSAHPHMADRAGEHIDLRLGDRKTGVAHSFVLPKARLPSPGEMLLAIPTFPHSIDYMDYAGTIGEGYGKGEVLKGRRSVAEVYHADPSDGPGTKLRFNLYDGSNPEEFAIRRDSKGRHFLHNKTQTREKRPDIPDFKPKYKEVDPDQIDLSDDSLAMMPKLDGAHGLVDLKAGRSPRVYSYRVAKKANTGLIEHTHKIPNLLKKKVPKELDGTVLRGEILGTKDGRVIPAETIGGLLNSKVWESRRKQAESGVSLKVFPFTVVKHKGRDVKDLPFMEKWKILETVNKYLDELSPPPMALTEADKKSLLGAVKDKSHPLTEEGVILVDKSGTKTIKGKFAPDYDVFVREIHPAVSGKTGETHDRAGAISYSWTPKGPIVGQLGGFKHDEARDMLRNPDKYVGRVAKVKAMKKFDDSKALFQPRFKEWHLDKGDIEKSSAVDKLAFLDELSKIAADRSLAKDFMAGVDPTGTYTFGYGIKDADRSGAGAAKRRAVGTAGGIIGGGLAVPTTISGLIGGATGYAKGGRKGAIKGFAQGFHKPITKPIKATKALLSFDRARGAASTNQIDPKDWKNLTGVLEGKAKEVAEKTPELAKGEFLFSSKRQAADMKGKIKDRLSEGVSTLGLSGAIGGGSAYLQYGKGRKAGKVMAPGQRKKVVNTL